MWACFCSSCQISEILSGCPGACDASVLLSHCDCEAAAAVPLPPTQAQAAVEYWIKMVKQKNITCITTCSGYACCWLPFSARSKAEVDRARALLV